MRKNRNKVGQTPIASLNAFYEKAEVGSLFGSDQPNAGIRMESNDEVGQSTYFNADGTKFEVDFKNRERRPAYRVFGQITVNSGGPFISKFAKSKPGKYPAGFLESQVLQVLHELAHMVQDKNGRPLIPNDNSKDPVTQKVASSEDNTETILTACRTVIDAMNKKK